MASRPFSSVPQVWSHPFARGSPRCTHTLLPFRNPLLGRRSRVLGAAVTLLLNEPMSIPFAQDFDLHTNDLAGDLRGNFGIFWPTGFYEAIAPLFSRQEHDLNCVVVC